MRCSKDSGCLLPELLPTLFHQIPVLLDQVGLLLGRLDFLGDLTELTAKILDIITRTTFGFFKQSLNSVQLNGGVSYFVLRALNMIKVVIIEASWDNVVLK